MYRVEQTGVRRRPGPYRNGEMLARILNGVGGEDFTIQPLHYNDGIAKYKAPYRYGFSSLKAFHAWFNNPEGIENAHAQNIGVLAIYRVPEKYVHQGGRQLIAITRYMKHLADLPLTITQTEIDKHGW